MTSLLLFLLSSNPDDASTEPILVKLSCNNIFVKIFIEMHLKESGLVGVDCRAEISAQSIQSTQAEKSMCVFPVHSLLIVVIRVEITKPIYA